MQISKRTSTILIGLLFFALYSLSAQVAENPAKAMLDKMKGLVGQWEGTYKWTGAREAKGTLKAEYYMTGYGTSLVENRMANDGTVSMSSVYHLDREDLRMTHFCAANNHPRLIAETMDEKDNVVAFEFVDITNFTNKKIGHVNGVTLKFPNPDELTLIFDYIAADGQSMETVLLNRVPTD